MLRWDHWKFIHYEGYEPQLFDLARDPGEREDLAARGTHRDVVRARAAEVAGRSSTRPRSTAARSPTSGR